MDLQVTDHYWQNKYISAKELYTWMLIHKIPRPTRVLFMTFQQIPFLRNISIHSLCNVQKVDYIVRLHFPEVPYDLIYTTDRDGIKFFMMPEDQDMVEDLIDALRKVGKPRGFTFYQKNWALCYKTKFQTIYMYNNS